MPLVHQMFIIEVLLPRQRRQGPADECKMLGLSLYTSGTIHCQKFIPTRLRHPSLEAGECLDSFMLKLTQAILASLLHGQGGGGREKKERGIHVGSRCILTEHHRH